ncbi:pseudouridine synthase [Oricola sp.]|uniref:pseudouridine synthase n=1 Tax=Oricola sp. TaxID=1979950 RepID=UPI003BAA13D1
MAKEDKPRRGRDKPAGKPAEVRGGAVRSRGYKDRPAGGGGGKQGKPHEKSRGFKDRPQDRVRGKDPAARTLREEKPAAAPAGADADAMPERISKLLARAGVASRRDVERMIEAGRVTVDGKVLDTPAFNVTGAETILIDGEPIPEVERTRLWLYHKPAGLVTTNRDPQGRPTVFERLPGDLPRVLSVGRLDINTEGLLLLTNDGGLARVLELPQTGWLRRYRVRAHGRIEQARLDELKNGIAVDGVFYGAVEAEIERKQGSNVWLNVGLREGKNREVKNILGALDLEVNRLIRVSYGPFQLGELPEGSVLEVRGRTLRDQLGAKLIEEAGSNFDAPVRKPFSNRPVRAGDTEPPRAQVTKRGDWVTSSHEGPPKRYSGKTASRDEALSRLDTRNPRNRAKPKSAPGGETDKQRHSRAANVWMAPGARPRSGPGAKSRSDTTDTGSQDRQVRESRGASGQPAGRKPGADRGRADISGQGKPRHDKPRHGKPGQGKPGQGRQGQGKPAHGKQGPGRQGPARRGKPGARPRRD